MHLTNEVCTNLSLIVYDNFYKYSRIRETFFFSTFINSFHLIHILLKNGIIHLYLMDGLIKCSTRTNPLSQVELMVNV